MVLTADNRKIALITDVTSGIGPFLVKNLCNSLKGIIYITSSTKKDGESLKEELHKEGLAPNVRIVDLSSESQISELASEIKQSHGGLDVLVTNSKKQLAKSNSLSVDEAEDFLNDNFFNVARLLDVFLPAMKAHGRVVLCTSQPGVHYGREFLRDAPAEQKELFQGEDVKMEGVKVGISNYLESVASGTPWTPQVDILATMALFALARLSLRRLQVVRDVRSLLINVGSVGWVLTAEGKTYLDERGNHKGEVGMPEETAAADVLWLAKLPRGTRSPCCELVKNRTPAKWKQ